MTLEEFLEGHVVPDWHDEPALFLALVRVARDMARRRGLQFADADDLAAEVLDNE